MNIFRFTGQTGRYGLIIASNEHNLADAVLTVRNVTGEEVQDFLSQTWEITRLTSAIEELFEAALSKDVIWFIQNHYMPYLDEAAATIRHDRRQRERHSLKMAKLAEKDRGLFRKLTQDTDPKSILMGAIFNSVDSDGSINLGDFFNSHLIAAMDILTKSPA